MKTVKIVTVGDGNVGKTSLLMTYTNDTFPAEYVPTVFDNFTAYINIDGNAAHLNLWDTAGQEEYDRLRALSYPQTDVFLLCFSIICPVSFKNVSQKWAPEIRHFCPAANIVLVGTKSDAREEHKQRARYTGIHPIACEAGVYKAREIGARKYIECSALTRKGLRGVFTEAVRPLLVSGTPQVKKKKDPNCIISVTREMQDTRREQAEHASASQTTITGQMQMMAADSMFSFLLQVCRETDLNRDDIELEVRLGFVQDFVFSSELNKADFDHLINKLDNSGIGCRFSRHNDFHFPTYQDQDGTHKRVRIRRDDRDRYERPEVKTSLKKEDFRVRDSIMPYDVRVSIAQEKKLRALDGNMPDDWSKVRQKERKSYNYNTPHRPWDIDLTVVTERSRTASARLTYEAEIEFHPVVLQWCRDPSKHDRLRNMLVDFYKNIWSLFGASREVSLFQKVSPDKNDQLQRMCNQALHQNARVDFPGSMPVNFRRKHFAEIQKKEYYVSEKTDGMRYLMVVTREGVYMCTRRYEFQSVPGASILCHLFPDSIFDGEMVKYEREKDRQMYLLFDVILYEGDNVSQKFVPDRLAMIGAAVGKWRYHMGKNPTDKFPFEFTGKVFKDKSEIRDLLKLMREHNGERFFEDRSRHHKTDGLVFTCRNEPYLIRSAHSMYKWKYSDKLSVDFRVVIERDNRLKFYVTSRRDSPEVEYNIEPKLSNRDELVRDIQSHERTRREQRDYGTIAELKYDPWESSWVYCNLRGDKTTPNHISILLDTLEVLSENVTTNEITFRMSGKSNEEWKSRTEEHLKGNGR
ncbi:hypothetical protein PROFUN_06588 [Planoprotostelium fungivorum]|uniref:Uncharacterized protein n=1 Tax=Planoprotostelium fungivorum TaxID=1890364 RepID=A0A2P6MRX5_9EUKA|nr:hypothetical protein PROFUN_06588 [Planoprotostelium fungivorum]